MIYLSMNESTVQDAPTFKPLKTGNRGAELRERGERGERGPEKMLTAVQQYSICVSSTLNFTRRFRYSSSSLHVCY